MSLFGVTNVHEPGPTEVLEYSITEWLKEGLLECGAFSTTQSGQIQPVSRPGVTANTLYQSPRADWVWESGTYNVSHVRPSGAYVAGVFHPFSSTCVPDYAAGTVTFSTPVSGSPVVKMNYSARTVRVYNPRANPNYQVQLDSYQKAQSASGIWGVDGRARVQLPAVFVQATPRAGRFTGYELGSLQRIHKQDVVFHVVAERPSDRDRLHDILVGQWQKRFNGVDQVQLQRDGRQSLLPAGNINPSGVGTYTAQAALYPWAQIRVCEVDSRPGGLVQQDPDEIPREQQGLFECVVVWRAECDLPSA